MMFAAAMLATASVWTNAVGMAFSAEAIALDDEKATFVFAEDGATNTVTLVKLSPESRRRLREKFSLPEIPPRLMPTWNIARRQLAAVAAMSADGRLTAEAAAERRLRIVAAFRKIARDKGVPEADLDPLVDRLLR